MSNYWFVFCLIHSYYPDKLVDSPVTFQLQTEDLDVMCKLAFNYPDYILHLGDILATELPPAPPIKKENLPPVCRSDVLEFMGETVARLTWILFLFGVRFTFTAEFNRRM